MVNCCVPGCTNFSTKTRYLEKVMNYHKIPSEPKIQRAWIARIRRENLPPLKKSYVCSEHFETDCFEKDLVLELTGKRKRNQALIKHGERRGEPRFNKSFPKMHKRWVVKPVMKKKSYDFLPELQIKVLEVLVRSLSQVDLPDNIASEPAPDKQDLIDRHRSRFAR
ncbi:THAP domain-containing protein 2 [Exaiptasia diaphana]|nr:THAP domain-containing protein 2 [Exaiptasia diaphana]